MSKNGNYTRPGVHAAVRLSKETSDAVLWKNIEKRYNDMILAKGSEKLVKLDQFCNTLATRLQKGKDTKFTSKDLLQIVEWKFAKGKPRYALMKHIKSNTDKSIQDCAANAFDEVANKKSTKDDSSIRSAIDAFCQLKGIGPATASAILSLYKPTVFAFMDDEVIEALYPGKRGYTLAIYLHVNETCTKLAKTLSSSDEEEWTPRRVGRALWTAARLAAENQDMTTSTKSSAKGTAAAAATTTTTKTTAKPAATKKRKIGTSEIVKAKDKADPKNERAERAAKRQNR